MNSLRFDSSLLAIYRKSYFQVKDSKGRLVRFTVKTLNRHPDLARKKFAVMTAWNPMNQTLTKKDNLALNRKLEHQLKSRGEVFYQTDGWLGKHYETGFTIEGIQVPAAVQLGREFRQYAILYNDWRGPRFLRCCPGHLFGVKIQRRKAQEQRGAKGDRKAS